MVRWVEVEENSSVFHLVSMIEVLYCLLKGKINSVIFNCIFNYMAGKKMNCKSLSLLPISKKAEKTTLTMKKQAKSWVEGETV